MSNKLFSSLPVPPNTTVVQTDVLPLPYHLTQLWCSQLLHLLYQLSTIAVQPAASFTIPAANNCCAASCFIYYTSCQQLLCSQLLPFLYKLPTIALQSAAFPLSNSCHCCCAHSCFLSYTSCQQLLCSQLFFLSITAASFPITAANKCCAASCFSS